MHIVGEVVGRILNLQHHLAIGLPVAAADPVASGGPAIAWHEDEIFRAGSSDLGNRYVGGIQPGFGW